MRTRVSTDDGNDNRQAVSAEDSTGILPDVLVSGQAELRGEEGITVVDQGVLIGDGAHEQQYDRQDHDQSHDDQDNINPDLISFFTFG